jgi:hypothetical protein
MVKVHSSCKYLSNLIDLVGRTSRGIYKHDRQIGISRIAKKIGVQSETVRRYADGKKGYERGVPFSAWHRIQNAYPSLLLKAMVS